jgi:hypothetical protein
MRKPFICCKYKESINVGDIFAVTADAFHYPKYEFFDSFYPFLGIDPSFFDLSEEERVDSEDYLFILKYLGDGKVIELTTGLIMGFRMDEMSDLLENSNLITSKGDTLLGDGVYEGLPFVHVRHYKSSLAEEDTNKYLEFCNELDAFLKQYNECPLSVIASEVYEVNDELIEYYYGPSNKERIKLIKLFYKNACNYMADINKMLKTAPSRSLMGKMYDHMMERAYIENDIYNFKKNTTIPSTTRGRKKVN